MPSHQSAVSTLIREVLADPDLAHDEVFRRLLQAGLQDLVDAEAAAVIGAQRHVAHPGDQTTTHRLCRPLASTRLHRVSDFSISRLP